MSTSMIEPGTRFAGRYRLESRASDGGGATLWKATDEILARPVSVLTFADDFPRVSDVVTAARAASRLTDSRLMQVFDAEQRTDHSYVVMEWVEGDYFDDLVARGTLGPERTASLVAEAAEALATAHASGIAHLCLTPRSVLWTSGGAVKVIGLGVNAALVGVSSDQPELRDVQGLGNLLYAGLTGHWPGQERTMLPAAPLTDGNRVATPRQVRAGVPANLDAVTCRALFPGSRRGEPITTAIQFADSLADVPRHVALPMSASPSPIPRTTGTRPPTTSPMQTGAHSATHQASPRVERSAAGLSIAMRLLVATIIILVLAAIGIGGWKLSHAGGGSSMAHASHGKTQPERTALRPQQAYGIREPGNSPEHPELGAKAIDGSSATDWRTQEYFTADFGKLRTGAGLRLDMGSSVKVSSAKVKIGPEAGAAVELRVGNSQSPEGARVVARRTDGSGTIALHAKHPAKGRYVFVWFTRLPPSGGHYMGSVFDVVIHGTR